MEVYTDIMGFEWTESQLRRFFEVDGTFDDFEEYKEYFLNC